MLGKRGGRVGLVLFRGDDDTSSTDVAWSYTGFGVFRRWPAQVEGFALDEMHGFGGQHPWNDVSTTLAPLLNHPDDGGPDLSPIQCAAILPRLQEIADQPQEGGTGRLLQRHIDDTRQLSGRPAALHREGRRPLLRLTSAGVTGSPRPAVAGQPFVNVGDWTRTLKGCGSRNERRRQVE